MSLSFPRICALKIIAQITPLVKEVLQTNFISVCVLPDTKVRGAKTVNKKKLSLSFKRDIQFEYLEAYKSHTNSMDMCHLLRLS